jgi:alpha-ribazole phosphatase
MMLLLVRHPVPDVATGLCYGRLDVPLQSDAGAAAIEIAKVVRRHGIRMIWSSPATRCVAPARAAAAAAQTRLRVDNRLQELDFGRWEGMRWTDIERSEFDRWAADPSGFAPPGGETGLALLARVSDLMQTLITEDEDCAVISHGGPLRILRALACGAAPDLLAAPPSFGEMIAINC